MSPFLISFPIFLIFFHLEQNMKTVEFDDTLSALKVGLNYRPFIHFLSNTYSNTAPMKNSKFRIIYSKFLIILNCT